MAQRLARDLRERPRQLDSCRAAADQHERQQLALPRGIGLALGPLEGKQDPPADVERVLERLQSWRMGRPLGVAEVGVARAGADDQEVVGERRPVGQVDDAAFDVDARRLSQNDALVGRAAQDPPDRRGDVPGRQRRCRDLVQERLEQVVIAPVQHGDADVLAAKRLRRGKAGEPSAEHDDM